MKIGTKLVVFFLVVTLISSVAGCVGVSLLAQIDKGYSNALINFGNVQGEIGIVMSDIRAISSDLLQAITTQNTSTIKQAGEDILLRKAEIESYRGSIYETLVTKEGQDAFVAVDETLPLVIESAQKCIALAEQKKYEEALRLYQNETLGHINKAIEGTAILMKTKTNMGDQQSVQLTASSNGAILLMVVIMAASLLLSVLVAVFTARSISRPLAACTQRLVLLSEGDLKTPVPDIRTQDETGILAQATTLLMERLTSLIEDLNSVLTGIAHSNLDVHTEHDFHGDFIPLQKNLAQIITSLNDTIRQIRQSADQVSSGSDQVSMGAQSLSQGTTEQASSVQELAATLNEVSVQIKENASSAAQARDSAKNVGSIMNLSNTQMHELTLAMDKITQSSSEIGKIIKTIEDIAFQTNILALNAAVEAARAGAAGKGFAVVADEVRNLASKSAAASKNTSGLIENSIRAVEEGTKIALTTAQSLQEAVIGATNVIEAIDSISSASDAQANSAIQITQGVDQIAAVVQTNSATAEQSAAASEELNGQAQMMKDLVGQFRLRESPSNVDSGSVRAAVPMAPAAPKTYHAAAPQTAISDKY